MPSQRVDVLGTTWPVAQAARDVRIDQRAVDALATRLAARPLERPTWRVWPHWWDDSPHTATYVLVLDALNFSFWGEPRWRVSYAGHTFDGYWALAAALRRGLEEGWPLLDARALARASEADVAHLLRGEGLIPMLSERVDQLRDVGRVLLEQYEGSFAHAVAQCGGSAERLVNLLARQFPSYHDAYLVDGTEVHLYKRAQLLVSDLFGAYGGAGLGRFEDLGWLTAFADYKVPQVLRTEAVLAYSAPLARQVDSLRPIPAGHAWEIEIRACTVWAVEFLRRALAARGRALLAFELDWLLWSEAQGRQLPFPYHRTRTTAY